MPQVTWPTTVGSSPMPVSDNCILPTLEHSLSVRRAAVLETGPLPPQDHKSGTVCHPISHYVGCHMASSGGYWRHFYSNSEATAPCELLLTAPNKNILTYLLTDRDVQIPEFWVCILSVSAVLCPQSHLCPVCLKACRCAFCLQMSLYQHITDI